MRVKDEDKVTRIYQAAVKLINTEGFQGTSMSKIAKEAGLAAATIYLYFSNKEDMLNKLYLHLKEQMSKAYLRGDPDLTPGKDAIHAIWINHYRYIVENPQEYKFLETFSSCPLIEKMSKEQALSFYRPLFSLLDLCRVQGVIRNLSDDVIYACLFAPVSYLAKQNCCSSVPLNDGELNEIFETAWSSVKVCCNLDNK
jgi:AcrR family transcriptional regulator